MTTGKQRAPLCFTVCFVYSLYDKHSLLCRETNSKSSACDILVSALKEVGVCPALAAQSLLLLTFSGACTILNPSPDIILLHMISASASTFKVFGSCFV